jgi:coproporphyrinogen III oxidase-like Fe-S oxidoreductase
MSNRANHNYGADGHPEQSRRNPLRHCKVLPRDGKPGLADFVHCVAASTALGMTESNTVRHIYVHIPFCARICPYCAFYKDLLDRSQTSRFCEAILRELEQYQGAAVSSPPGQLGDLLYILPSTIYFGGGTPTALNKIRIIAIG